MFKKGDPKTKAAAARGGASSHGDANKHKQLTDVQRQQLAAAAGGITPLEFACSVLRDPVAPMKDKQWAAELLMPYMHRKLPMAVDITQNTVLTTVNAEALAKMEGQELENLINLLNKITEQSIV